MTGAQRELAGGIAALVRASNGGAIVGYSVTRAQRQSVFDHAVTAFGVPGSNIHPPLSPLQTLALSVLVAPDVECGSMLLDALRECGVIDAEWEEVVRKDERERAAKLCESEGRHWGPDGAFANVRAVLRRKAVEIRNPPPLPTTDSGGTV